MTKALVITALGGIIETQLDDLKSMQRVVGGLIQPVELQYEGDGYEMFVNEEGLLIRLPANPLAHEIVRESTRVNHGWIPVGDVFLLGPVDSEGESTDVPDNVVRLVKHIAARAVQS